MKLILTTFTFYFTLLLSIAYSGDGDINKVNRIAVTNKLKAEAETAFNNGDYKNALQKYTLLYDSLQVNDENILLNKAHCYFNLNDTANTEAAYKYALESAISRKNRSIINQQLGILAQKKGQKEEALKLFKQALREDPTNHEARYNYELLKKWKDEQDKKDQQNKDKDKKEDKNKDKKEDQKKDQQKKDQNKQDQQNKDQQDKKDQKDQQNKKGDQDKDKKEDQKKDGNKGDKGDQDKKDQEKNDDRKGKDGDKKEDKQDKDNKDPEKGDQSDEQKKSEKDKKDKDGQMSPEEKKALEKKEQQEQMAQRFKEMNMSKEKAQMILNAMNNKEKQYYQQLNKKPTQRIDRNKPDW